jgi:imidazolonepropionase-like amidohydrolase
LHFITRSVHTGGRKLRLGGEIMGLFGMSRRVVAVAAAVVTATCATPIKSPAIDADTAFIGVTIIPMTDATTLLADQTVLVRDGAILSIGHSSTTPVPARARRIDGRGKFLMPGLADMHVHLEYLDNPDILKLFVASGVTTVRNMDGRPYIIDWRRRVEAGELVGPRIVTAGPIIDGSPPLRDDNLSVADAAAAAAAINAQADAGYDFVKLYTNLSPQAYRAAVAEAKRRGKPVSGHIPRQIEVAEAIASHRSIEHLTDYGEALEPGDGQGSRRWHWSKLYLAQPLDPDRLPQLARELALAGTWTVPTLVQPERAVATAEQIESWLAAPAMHTVPQAFREAWAEEVRRNSARLEGDDWLTIDRGRANRRALVLAIHRAGGPLLAGTDTPNAFVIPGFSLPDELELLVAAGLSPGNALLAATRDAARYLGQESSWGTVEPRRRADVVLLDANPLKDIRNVRLRSGVMLSGRWFSRAELDALARALVAAPAR